jgi:hypothetical protein
VGVLGKTGDRRDVSALSALAESEGLLDRKTRDIHDKDLSRENRILPGRSGRIFRSAITGRVTLAEIGLFGSDRKWANAIA